MNTQTPPIRSLAQGNRFQRAYHRWAQPYYTAMPPDLREQAEAIDRHLYSREGLFTWAGALGAIVGTGVGLRSLGMPLSVAFLLSGICWVALLFGALSAWLRPEPLLARARRPRQVMLFIALGLCGAVVGMAFGQYLKLGYLDPLTLLQRFSERVAVLAPLLLVVLAGIGLLMWGVARTRQAVLQRQRDRARLEAERDAATAQAREAELRLLQAQIHPHFIFNTLAALQHWVDRRDERAGPLLRELSGFLRRSTEMLGRAEVSLGEELTSVRHYLAIMQARWGERLRYTLELDPALDARTLPPGLLLTLVENAIEHGLAAKLDGGNLTLRTCPTANGWQVQVQDDGAGLPAGWQEGVGLANLRQRLQHRFGAAAELRLQSRPAGGCQAELLINETRA